MAAKQTIEVVLEKHPTLAATGITIPFDVEKVFGAKRVPVKATVNGAVYTGSIVRMGGKYMLGIPKAFREEAGISAGDTIKVTIEADTAPRTVEVPKDLASAIKKAGLSATWEKLSYTHRKEHVRAVVEAKRPETRVKRIETATEMLAGKKK
ncbi:MAG TPA: YdeI/OmpD-associated family protein [Pyrinomonadaceae bacterium]|jgi:bifunctional DNA-binding transcriptional regulator/antitoxin component of YhaV-PrlF toxin-antitoxin module|nr:YdeI/OmpD-associated family protein [Pyrinomonadaceae bacterium]